MKHFFSFFIFFLLLSSCRFGQTIDALDAKNGFRDAKFGTPFSEFNGLIASPYSTSDNVNTHYIRASENKMLGEVPLFYVEYNFLYGKLRNIDFVVKGATNQQIVVRGLKEAFGPGKDYVATVGTEWEGENVILTYLSMNENAPGDYGLFSMTNTKMLRDLVKLRKQKEQNASQQIANEL